MSVGGTLASVIGGAVMGLTMSVCLILESSQCRETWMSNVLTTTLLGAISGGTGSLVCGLLRSLCSDSHLSSKVDSILGATIQQTKFSESKKLILQDESIPTGPIKVISGVDILTGNQVSVESFTATQYLNTLRRSMLLPACSQPFG